MQVRIFPFLLLLSCTVARASDLENPNFMPFGEQEAYLGNAGIGVEDSTGAVYYNPGALGFVTGKKASVYGNAYAMNKFSSRSAIGGGNPDFVVSSSSYSGVPLSSVTLFSGDSFTYAFSFNTPYSSKKSISSPFKVASVEQNILLDIAEDSLWLGPSLAKKVSERVGVGVSLFAVRDSIVLNQLLTQFVVAGGARTTIAGRAEVSNWSALLVLGAQYRASSELNFGVRVQTPSLDLRGRTDFFGVTHTASGQVIQDETGIHSVFRRPFNFGMGSKYSPWGGADFFLDLNAQLPVHFNSAPSRAAVNSHTDTRFKARANLGAKIRLDKINNILAGLMLNPSTVDAGGNLDLLSTSEDYRGATLGLQKDLGPLLTSAGGFFLWSNATYKNQNSSVVSEYRHRIYGLLLTASYKL